MVATPTFNILLTNAKQSLKVCSRRARRARAQALLAIALSAYDISLVAFCIIALSARARVKSLKMWVEVMFV